MKKMKSMTKWTLAVASMMSLLVACGKKDDGGSTTAAVNVCANVPNGQTVNGQLCQNGVLQVPGALIGNALLNNVQFQSSYMSGTMNIGGTNTGNTDFNNPAAYAYYSGPMSVTGTIQVTQQLCGATVGTYTIMNNAQAGQFNMGLISNLNITASGPGTLQLVGSWMTSQVYNPNGLYRDASGNRIGLNAQLIVNGQPCGGISTY